MLALTTFNRSARTEKTAKRLMKMVYGR
jgi:hypothetical protein